MYPVLSNYIKDLGFKSLASTFNFSAQSLHSTLDAIKVKGL